VTGVAPPPTDRRSRAPFRRAAIVLAVTAFAAGLPTPIYPLYEQQFGFGSSTLALVFAAYTAGVVATLFLVAPLSDMLGRKPVLRIGMLFTAASALAFLFANGAALLALARVLSGLAVGATTSTATAAMASLEPRRDQHHVARVSVAANFGGVAIGILLSGLLVEYAPLPTQLVFLLLLAASALGFGLLEWVPETVPVAERTRRASVRRLAVPPSIDSAFWISVGGLAACYSLYGLFAALTPSLLHEGLSVTNHAVVGVVVGSLFGFAALIQLALGQLRDRDALLLGLPVLLGGLVLLVVALGATSLPLLALGAAVLGLGVGSTFMGSVTLIDRISPEESRGEILAAFYLVGYLSLAVPTIGVAELSVTLGLRLAGAVFGAALALTLAFLYLLTRRTPTPAGGGGWTGPRQ
jgi:MFS family permease